MGRAPILLAAIALAATTLGVAFMGGAIIGLFAGLGFLLAAAVSFRNGVVQMKSGYQIKRSTDPLGFWGAIACLVGIGLSALLYSASKYHVFA